ncbi:sigma-70 family RNA polymerase sigma factor [Rhizobium vallis]|uniref:Sigma-70 family RNA polymerase sigma factor n=2 Tax=Rhizobium vallis TaxID=634290 RepID=A0A3S0RDK2_9HYPH|nr:sigma-70 family RNA polymerase sigma factor [Rhizobium vallis]
MRSKLHRYCARMTGSVIDGEDVVQDALVKAIEAAPSAGPIANPEGWLFRIAHNAALDFLRRRARERTLEFTEDTDMVVETRSAIEDREIVAASLRTFMRLPLSQRSSVILADVLGNSLRETAEIVDGNVLAIKGALQRGRERLRGFAAEDDNGPVPELDEPDRQRLKTYVDLFNAHDFDAIKAMLAEDIRFEVVNKVRRDGKSALPYFTNYGARPHWRLLAGFVDGRPAALVYDGEDPDERIKYFVLLEWTGDQVTSIRDFVFARYAMEGADIRVMD